MNKKESPPAKKELTNFQSKQVCEGGHGHSLDLSHVGAALAVRYLRYPQKLFNEIFKISSKII